MGGTSERYNWDDHVFPTIFFSVVFFGAISTIFYLDITIRRWLLILLFPSIGFFPVIISGFIGGLYSDMIHDLHKEHLQRKRKRIKKHEKDTWGYYKEKLSG